MRWLVATLTVLALSACGGPDDPALKPAELQPIAAPMDLAPLWSTRLGSGAGDSGAELAPAEAGGWLFVADHKGRLYAVEAQAGALQWQIDTDERLAAGPGAGGELVVLGTKGAELIAYSRFDGSELWRTRVSSEVLAAPVVAPLPGGGLAVVVQSGDGVVAAYRGDDGARLWVLDREVPALSLRGSSRPEVSGGRAVLGFANGQVAAVELLSGRVVWETAVAVPRGRSELDRLVDVDTQAVIYAGSVYSAAYNGQVVALALADGRLEWDRALSAHQGLAVDVEQVYVTDAEDRLWALQRRNGASLWQQDAFQRRAMTAPLKLGDYLLVGDYEGWLHLLAASDGAQLARVRVDSDGLDSAPIRVGEAACVYGRGGRLACYQPQR